MNTFTLSKRLGRLWHSLLGAVRPRSRASEDPYEKYRDRIPNRRSRRAMREIEQGKLKTYDSAEELFADLDDE